EDDLVGQLGEVGQAQLRHGQGDHPGAAAAEVARREVHLVTEFGDRVEHPAAGRVAHVWELVDHIGHRLDRHAGQPGDVAHGGGHFASPPEWSHHGRSWTTGPATAYGLLRVTGYRHTCWRGHDEVVLAAGGRLPARRRARRPGPAARGRPRRLAQHGELH